LFATRVWHVRRPVPEPEVLAEAARLIRAARRPLLVAGGGVIYSEATGALRALVDGTGIPEVETQSGKGSLPYDHALALGAIGATGTPAANDGARRADLVIGVGTRWSDFTTASHTIFADPEVRFVNINVVALDAAKHAGLPVVGDARVALAGLREGLAGYQVGGEYRAEAGERARAWDAEVSRIYHLGHHPLLSQGEVIGAVNEV
ncbi:MAG: 3D-(3,5/4)-trihydroxycyclohexane-1,2-dione acylhydrolase (decyclizing), partial [Acidimicrobiales bacterium]